MTIQQVHAAMFDYNFVFRALWGEKWCMTPLQDLDPLQAIPLHSMVYRTIGPDNNNPGWIALAAQDMASMLPFIQHYDPKFMGRERLEYRQHHNDSPGVISPRTLVFTDKCLHPIDLIDGMIITTTDSESWSMIMRWESTTEFYRFCDKYLAVRARWSEIMDERASVELKNAWLACNKIFRPITDRMFSAEELHSHKEYRELMNMVVDVYLGRGELDVYKLGEAIRYECIADIAKPLRELYYEVRKSIDNKEAQIL